MKSLFIFAGEHSGDLHGSYLLKALKERIPELAVEGVGGPLMRSQGIHPILKMEDFEVMGLTDVLLALPKLYKNFHRIKRHILETSPEVVILIDYPGFNLRMAQALRRKGYGGKIIQYVSPSVWAWGKHRIEIMAETLDLLLSIYPFETEYFAGTGLKTAYVGNPIQEYIANYHYDDTWHQKLGIPHMDKMLGLFPGSRQGEIARNLPIMLAAVERLRHSFPKITVAISYANESTSQIIKEILNDFPDLKEHVYLVPKKYTYELMRDCHSAIAKSGTVTLELALHHRPTVVIYKLTRLNRLYAKYILKLKLSYYCIVNILAKKSIFPELIEDELSADKLFKRVAALYEDGEGRLECIQQCHSLQTMLGQHHTSRQAADEIAGLLPR